MKKIFIALLLATASCSPGGVLSSPAPCSATVVDERTLVIALQSFDTMLTAVDRLVKAKVIVPGSPKAVQIADAIHAAKVGYQTASAAQRACNSSSYFTALTQASTAVARINSLIKG